jgi:hypothetical protein
MQNRKRTLGAFGRQMRTRKISTLKRVSVIALLLGLFTTSCKKEYPCECVVTQSFGTYNQNSTNTTMTPKMTKNQAREYCEQSSSASAYGVSQSVECKLKD